MSDTTKNTRSPSEAAKVVFDMWDTREARKYIPHTDFQKKVKSVLDNFDARTFRKLCLTAIAHGLTSSQDILNACGDVIPHNPKKLETEWSLPNPAKCRAVLMHFATLDIDAGADGKATWRHEAKPKEQSPGFANYVR